MRYTLQERIEIISDVMNKTRARRSRTAKNRYCCCSPKCCCLDLGITQTSLHRILHKDLGPEAYEVQFYKLKLAEIE